MEQSTGRDCDKQDGGDVQVPPEVWTLPIASPPSHWRELGGLPNYGQIQIQIANKSVRRAESVINWRLSHDVDDTSTADKPWWKAGKNRLSSEFGTRLQITDGNSLILKLLEFCHEIVSDKPRAVSVAVSVPKSSSICSVVSTQYRRMTHKQRGRQM